MQNFQHPHPPEQAYVFVQVPPALLAQIVKIPPNKGNVSYQQLVCTEQDQAHVFEIISTMSENGKLSLLLKQSHLKELGAQINHLHPFKFLEVIFTNDHLKTCMPSIFDDYFKRNGFMEGLGPSLTNEADKGKLDQHVIHFAKEVNVSPEALQPYVTARDWENLVRYLIVHSQSPLPKERGLEGN